MMIMRFFFALSRHKIVQVTESSVWLPCLFLSLSLSVCHFLQSTWVPSRLRSIQQLHEQFKLSWFVSQLSFILHFPFTEHFNLSSGSSTPSTPVASWNNNTSSVPPPSYLHFPTSFSSALLYKTSCDGANNICLYCLLNYVDYHK